MDVSEIRLVSKIQDLGVTSGFQVGLTKNGEYKLVKLPTDKLIAFIQRGAKVAGADLFEGELVVQSDLYTKLPVLKDVYKITDEIKDDNGTVIGYNIQNMKDSTERRVNMITAWRLAFDDCLYNCEARVLNSSKEKIIIRRK